MELRFADYCNIAVIIISIISLCMSYHTGREIDKMDKEIKEIEKMRKH